MKSNHYFRFNNTTQELQQIHGHPDLESFGLFETIKVFQGRTCLLEKHLTRLFTSAKFFSLYLAMNQDALQNGVKLFIHEKKLKNSVLKIMVLRETGSRKSSCFFTYRDNIYTRTNYIHGFNLNLWDKKRDSFSPEIYHKTTNNQRFQNHVTQRQTCTFDETIILNTKGYICEGLKSNIFFVHNSKMYTPHISCGLLPGVTRNFLIDKIIPQTSLHVNEGKYSESEFLQSEEIFLTNSVMGVMPVVRVNKTVIGLGKPGYVTKEIMKLYSDYENAVC